MLGLGGDDSLIAQPQSSLGNCFRGGAGPDHIIGGGGGDSIDGDNGDDRIRGGPGRNQIDAGPGNDELSSVNGIAESVRCGTGRDEIWADRRDRLSGCEKVHLVRNPFAAVTRRVGSPATTFHLTYRSPFSTDDPCDCVGFWVELTEHPARGGCGRTTATGGNTPATAGARSARSVASCRAASAPACTRAICRSASTTWTTARPRARRVAAGSTSASCARASVSSGFHVR